MKSLWTFALSAAFLFAAAAQGREAGSGPRIDYVYPAGARAGASLEVLVGGRPLQNATDVYVSGGGVHVRISKFYRPMPYLKPSQRALLQARLAELAARRMADLGISPGSLPVFDTPLPHADRPTDKDARLPDSPLLRDLDTMSLRQLVNVADEFLDRRMWSRLRLDPRCGALLLLKVRVDAGAAPGRRYLRVAASEGLSNPLPFQVGVLPEAREQEPNAPFAYPNLPPEPPLELPVVVNGQITPGDVDRISFRAARGQHLVFETWAESPADGFEPALAVSDPQGRPAPFDGEWHGGRDPAFYLDVPRDGVYQLDVRNALDGGRRTFVYRIAIGELPFITSAFPLGGRAGHPTAAAVDGWNLPARTLALDTRPGAPLRRAVLTAHGVPSNPITYAVGSLPERTEREPNDDDARAQRVSLPLVINGRIGKAGDVDVYRFDGRAGQDVVVQADARRLGSSLDALLRLSDASGKAIAETGSYLTARLPADGTYFVRLTDAQGRGGPDYGYRLRVSPPRPDFRLTVSPSSLSVPIGSAAVLSVQVVREDGFTGPVKLALAGAPAGFSLSGGAVPAGRDGVRITVSGPAIPPAASVELRLMGTAEVAGRAVSHAADTADGAALLADVDRFGWQAASFGLADAEPVRVPAGGSALVTVRARLRAPYDHVVLVPSDPPPGISVDQVQTAPNGLTFLLRADGKDARPGLADNLIIRAYAEVTFSGNGPRANVVRHVPLGVLPAIAFEVSR